MNNTRRCLIIVSILLIAACSMPVTRIYSLYIPVADTGSSASLKAPLAIRIAAPDYLMQPYIAYRSSPYQLRISKYAKWEESPLKMVRNEMRRALSVTGVFTDVNAAGAAPRGAYILKVQITRFERFVTTGRRAASLQLEINLGSPDGQTLYHRAIVKEKLLQGDDFEELARALSELLGEAVRESRDALVNVLIR